MRNIQVLNFMLERKFFLNLYRNFKLSRYYTEALMTVAIVILPKRYEVSFLDVILQEIQI
jgi:hypothetical protein